jgi:hypothetical protein
MTWTKNQIRTLPANCVAESIGVFGASNALEFARMLGKKEE